MIIYNKYITNKLRQAYFYLGTLLAFLLIFLQWSFSHNHLLLGLLAGIMAVLFFLAYGFNLDVLQPYHFSLVHGRYLSERRAESDIESFKGAYTLTFDFLTIVGDKLNELKFLIIGLTSVFLSFSVVFTFIIYNINITLKDVGERSFYNSYFFKISLSVFFIILALLVFFILRALLKFILIRKPFEYETLFTFDNINLFNNTYTKHGILETFSFDHIIGNLIILSRLGLLLEDNKKNLDLLRFWQGARLYLAITYSILPESKFIHKIKIAEKYIMQQLLDIDESVCVESESLNNYWVKENFNTDDYPFLKKVPKKYL